MRSDDPEPTVHLDMREVERDLERPESVHFLVVIEGHDESRLIELGDAPLVLGRSPEADVRLDSEGVSSTHCRVAMQAGSLLIEDLHSTNGVLVDDHRVSGRAHVPVGSVVRIGRTQLVHEVRDPRRARRLEAIEDELRDAAEYVRALLPEPLETGPVRIRWQFLPSVHLGGDAFGYHWLDEQHLAIYLLDVCGHGPGAALHSAAVINVLRSGSLKDADPARPDQVLTAVNGTFPMDLHGELFLTLWYGVYDVPGRTLVHASAGHPPPVMRSGADDSVRELPRGGLAIGVQPETPYTNHELPVPPGSLLYVFSDGAYEVRTASGDFWTREEFGELIAAPRTPGVAEDERVETGVRDVMDTDRFTDDFSLVVVEFR